jgi:hypothetical protein
MTRQLSKSFIWIISIAVLLLATAAAADRSNQEEASGRQAKLYLPIAGSATGGGTFAGTFFVQRFEARDGRVVAIGMVSGSVSGAGTMLAGPVARWTWVRAANQRRPLRRLRRRKRPRPVRCFTWRSER